MFLDVYSFFTTAYLSNPTPSVHHHRHILICPFLPSPLASDRPCLKEDLPPKDSSSSLVTWAAASNICFFPYVYALRKKMRLNNRRPKKLFFQRDFDARSSEILGKLPVKRERNGRDSRVFFGGGAFWTKSIGENVGRVRNGTQCSFFLF